jgi:GT2 family glycosyltransferase
LPACDPEVFAVILNWRGAAEAARCAEALTASEGIGPDFVIVDNGSGDGSYQELVARFGPERVVGLEVNGGYAAGMNAGLRLALERTSAPYVLLLTQDTMVEPDTVAGLVRVLASDPAAGIAGPVIVYADDPVRVFSAGKWHDPGRARLRPALVTGTAPVPVDSVDGCCAMVRRDVLVETGLLDERYFLYYEETELCRRAQLAGWRLLVLPAARASQRRPQLPGPHYFHYMSRNAYLFWRSAYGVAAWRVGLAQLVETARLAGSLVLSIAGWRRHDPAVLVRRIALQVRGVMLGTRDHLLGREGRIAGYDAEPAAGTSRVPASDSGAGSGALEPAP